MARLTWRPEYQMTMMLSNLLPSPTQLATVLPFLPGFGTRHHGSVTHPLVSLLVIALILVLIARTFRRKPSD
ncbi:MAG TPA: hypothetical protein VGF88_13170 [Acidobacteriaceae bacterium]